MPRGLAGAGTALHVGAPRGCPGRRQGAQDEPGGASWGRGVRRRVGSALSPPDAVGRGVTGSWVGLGLAGARIILQGPAFRWAIIALLPPRSWRMELWAPAAPTKWLCGFTGEQKGAGTACGVAGRHHAPWPPYAGPCLTPQTWEQRRLLFRIFCPSVSGGRAHWVG